MRAARLASLGGLAAATLLVALWLRRDDEPTRASPDAAPPAASIAVTSFPSRQPAAVASTGRPAEPTGTRPGEAELRAQATQESFARVGGVLVDYLVERGLARADSELVVQRFLADSTGCLFDALRLEADVQSVAYDSILDALEAELYDTDGPLLGALIDMRAVLNRLAPCAQTAAQHAGIEPAALPEATRAAIVRGLR